MEKDMTAKLLGAFGEMQAAEYLKKRGYKILGLNYRCRCGEIDIVAKKRKTTVIVEVKTRRSRSWADAGEYVNAAKQRRLRMTAAMWLQQYGGSERSDCRFDVIEVYADDNDEPPAPGVVRFKVYAINHIEGAF